MKMKHAGITSQEDGCKADAAYEYLSCRQVS